MITSLQKLSFHNNSWRKFSLKKFIVLVLFLVILISFTIYAYAITVLIPVGILPFEVAINPITNKAYVAHVDGFVHVIDTTDNTAIVSVTPPIPIPVSPGNALTGITVNPLTNKIYVANSGINEVAVIDGSDDTLLTTIPLVSPLDGTPVGIFPIDVEVNTILCTLYVSNILSLTVVIINLGAGCIGSDTVTPENQIIDVLDGTENFLTNDFRFDSPARFTFVPSTNLMYMTNFFKNEVSVLDGTQNAVLLGGFPVLPSITIFPSAVDGIAFNPTNNKIYVANSGNEKVSVIDVNFMSGMNPNFNTFLGTIDVGLTPVGVGVDALNNRIYVSNKDEGTVSVIDGESDTVVKTIPTDISTPTPRPKGLDVHSITGTVYVANAGIGSGQGKISVINFADPSPPIARAGPDIVVDEGLPVTLDGASSSDSDGDGLSFFWFQTDGPTVTLSSSTSTTFTAPQVNADTLMTFLLTVTDPTPFSSIPDVVNVVVKDTTTFEVSTTLTDGVFSGSQFIGDVFDGSTYTLQIDGVLPSAELQQLVIATGVTGSGVTFDFTESSQVPSGIVQPDTETALYFDLTFGGVDFSEPSNFESGILPKVQFLVDSTVTSAQSFADGCAVMQIELLNKVTGLWELIGNPLQANTNKIYVSNLGSGITPGTLSVIDGNTNNLIDTITIGLAPKFVAFDQNTNRIYVANQGSGTVSVIDGFTNSVIAEIPVGLGPQSNPIKPVVNPITGLIYVSNQVVPTVSVIDGSTNSVIAEIPVAVSTGIDIDTTLNKIYVTNGFSSTVSVIDGDLDSVDFNTVIEIIPTPLPTGVVVDSINNRAYVNNYDDKSVSVINTELDIVIDIIPVGSSPANVGFNPTTNRLYVANQGSGTVSIIDTEINAVIATVATGIAPFDVAVNPNTNRVYVANRGSGTVSVIDGMPGSPTENLEIAKIAGFSNNFGLALNPNVPNPVRDPSKDVGGQCAYIAEPPHFSKFAIGGVALALGGLGGGTDGSAPITSLGTLISNSNFEAPDEIVKIVENYDPSMILESISTSRFPDFDFPLTINENGYPLASYSNIIETFSGDVGEPISITALYYEQSVIQHVSMYLNLRDTNTGDLSKSDTQILYNKDKPLDVIDPNGYFESVSVNIVEDGDNKKFAQFEIVFAKSLEKSDIVLRSWDEKLRSLDTIIYDAIEVIGSENIVDDTLESVEELIPQDTDLQQDTQAVPEWIKNNAEWWSQGEIDDATFKKSIQFLIQEKIINVPTGPNVSVSKDDEFVEEEVEQTFQIPKWIKNNAEWWYLGQLTDNEFTKSIEYLVKEGIIKI